MICYGYYNVHDGEILFYTKQAKGVVTSANVTTDITPIQLPNANKNYYVDITQVPHVALQKTPHPLSINKTEIIADATDECVITGVHNPSQVTWPDGVTETVTDGEVRFTIDLAGSYEIKIQAIPYFAEVINVTATDPT